MPSPGMTASVGLPVSRAAAGWSVSGMRRTLVVVRTLAAAVSQVKRGLDGGRRVLRAARVLRVVGRGAPGVGIHLVHRSHSYVRDGVGEPEAADTAAGREAGRRGSPGPGCRPTSVRVAQDCGGPAAKAVASSSAEQTLGGGAKGRVAEPRRRRTPRRGGPSVRPRRGSR